MKKQKRTSIETLNAVLRAVIEKQPVNKAGLVKATKLEVYEISLALTALKGRNWIVCDTSKGDSVATWSATAAAPETLSLESLKRRYRGRTSRDTVSPTRFRSAALTPVQTVEVPRCTLKLLVKHILASGPVEGELQRAVMQCVEKVL